MPLLIETLETTDGHLRDVKFELSPQLNCIIGARGTCKSTIVETLRFLFDDDPAKVQELLREPDDGDGPRGLVKATLGGGTARISVVEGEERATIERDVSSDPRIFQDGVKSVDGTELLSKIEIYSQGELQEIATDPARRLALVDRPHKAVIDRWRAENAEIGSRIAALGPHIRALKESIESARLRLEEERALRSTLDQVRATRPAMSNEMLRSRQQFQHRQRLQGLAEQLVANYLEARDDLIDAVSRLGEVSGDGHELTKAPSAELAELAAILHRGAQGSLSAMASLPSPSEVREQLVVATAATERSSVAYYDLLRQEKAVTDAVKREDALATQIAHLDRIRATAQRNEAELARLELERATARQQMKRMRTEVFHRRLDEVERINQEFSNDIVLALNHGAQREGYASRLEELLQRSRLRDQSNLCRQIAASIPADKLIQLVEDDDAQGLAAVLNRDPGQMLRMISHLSEADDLYQLEGAVPDDELKITMFVDDVPKSVGEMSKGQKATAILPLVLRAADYPLVLDQPEDDLDNRFIFDTLVDRVRSLKATRQLIFVTHNANIPVIGDADRVFLMTMDGPYRAALTAYGDVPAMKREIVSLLEGGKQAFEYRSQVYGYEAGTRT